MACCNIIPKFDFKRSEPAAPTNYEYYFDKVEAPYIYNCCCAWFGIQLTIKQEKEVLEMLKTYPAPTEDEAIETVLIIYLNNKKS